MPWWSSTFPPPNRPSHFLGSEEHKALSSSCCTRSGSNSAILPHLPIQPTTHRQSRELSVPLLCSKVVSYSWRQGRAVMGAAEEDGASYHTKPGKWLGQFGGKGTGSWFIFMPCGYEYAQLYWRVWQQVHQLNELGWQRIQPNKFQTTGTSFPTVRL